MDESDLKRVDDLENHRKNGPRVRRLMREMYVSAADPQAMVRTICKVIAAILLVVGSTFALISAMLAD